MHARLHLLLVAFLFAATGLFASVESVRRAQSRFGSDVWTQAIEITNTEPTTVYPKVTYALVFEFNSILWLYTPYDGTQSLSLYRGRLAQDQANVQPLLKEIHPGFVSYAALPEDPTFVADESDLLPNGCFVESLTAARELLMRGDRLLRAGILLFYAKGTTQQGHAVLAYETEAGVFIEDVDRQEPAQLKGEWTDEALALAKRYLPELRRKLASARFVPVTVGQAQLWAAAARKVVEDPSNPVLAATL